MSSTTKPWPTAYLKRIVALSAAGQTAAQIAQQIDDIPVPRDGADHPCNWPDRGVVPGDVAAAVEPDGDGAVTFTLTADSGRPSRDGYNLDTSPGNPSRWTAAAVAQVLAAPEADPAGNYTAARAKLGSDTVTTLTVA